MKSHKSFSSNSEWFIYDNRLFIEFLPMFLILNPQNTSTELPDESSFALTNNCSTFLGKVQLASKTEFSQFHIPYSTKGLQFSATMIDNSVSTNFRNSLINNASKIISNPLSSFRSSEYSILCSQVILAYNLRNKLSHI